MGCSGSKAGRANEVAIKPKAEVNSSAKKVDERAAVKTERAAKMEPAQPLNHTKEENSKVEVPTKEADSSKNDAERHEKPKLKTAEVQKNESEVHRKHSDADENSKKKHSGEPKNHIEVERKHLEKPIDKPKGKTDEELVGDWLNSVYSSVKTHL